MLEASCTLHVDVDGTSHGMATHDDSYTSHGCPSQRSLLFWNGNTGWVKIWRQRFRSTWQEGVVAVATALNRTDQPDKSHTPGNGYDGDLVAPMIRDVGLALAMGDTVVDVMAAQMGKAGSNQNGGHDGAGGRDLHIGAWHVGVLPPTAPLPIASATMTGLAFAGWKQSLGRFHVACIGEGASSSGEYWKPSILQEHEDCQSATFSKTTRLPSTRLLLISLVLNCGLTKPLQWDSPLGRSMAPIQQHGTQVWQQLGNLVLKEVGNDDPC